jgi:hypothetical protein
LNPENIIEEFKKMQIKPNKPPTSSNNIPYYQRPNIINKSSWLKSSPEFYEPQLDVIRQKIEKPFYDRSHTIVSNRILTPNLLKINKIESSSEIEKFRESYSTLIKIFPPTQLDYATAANDPENDVAFNALQKISSPTLDKYYDFVRLKYLLIGCMGFNFYDNGFLMAKKLIKIYPTDTMVFSAYMNAAHNPSRAEHRRFALEVAHRIDKERPSGKIKYELGMLLFSCFVRENNINYLEESVKVMKEGQILAIDYKNKPLTDTFAKFVQVMGDDLKKAREKK